MKITKLGHCCLLIELNGKRLLTDPGMFSSAQNQLADLDAVFITHEHPDHLHMESVKAVLKNNSRAKIFTVSAVGKILAAENIACEILGHGVDTEFAGIAISVFGEKHAEIYKTVTPVENAGFLFGEKLWYPGDAFTIPPKPVEILALPVAGPWLKISEAIDYALTLKPKACFPVHDANLKSQGVAHILPQKILAEMGINFQIIKDGESADF